MGKVVCHATVHPPLIQSPLDKLDTAKSPPVPKATRKSRRSTGGRVVELDEVPPNEADRTTTPAKRRGRTKPGKDTNREVSADASGDQPPTIPSTPNARSKPGPGKNATPASKGPPSAATAPATSPTKRQTNIGNNAAPAPGPKPAQAPRRDTTSAQANGGHGPRAPEKGPGSKSQVSTAAAATATQGTSKGAGTTTAKTNGRRQSDAEPAGTDGSGRAPNPNADPEVLKEMESLRAQLARANKKLKKRSQSSTGKKSASKPKPPAQPLIPRPSGTLGKDWHLRAAMGLVHDKPLYTKILADVRKLVIKALDTSKGIRGQDPVKLGAIYEVARNQRPFLARFENDWATSQIIIQYLSNLRKQESSSESEDDGGNTERRKEKTSKTNGKGKERRRHGTGKHTHNKSSEAEGRLRAARAVLRGQVDTADNSGSGESGDEVEGRMAVDQAGPDDDDEDQDQDQGEDGDEGPHGWGRGGASDGAEEVTEGEDEEDEDEDEGLDMPPAKRRKVALVLPEDE